MTQLCRGCCMVHPQTANKQRTSNRVLPNTRLTINGPKRGRSSYCFVNVQTIDQLVDNRFHQNKQLQEHRMLSKIQKNAATVREETDEWACNWRPGRKRRSREDRWIYGRCHGQAKNRCIEKQTCLFCSGLRCQCLKGSKDGRRKRFFFVHLQVFLFFSFSLTLSSPQPSPVQSNPLHHRRFHLPPFCGSCLLALLFLP